jgi:hypothetical protein
LTYYQEEVEKNNREIFKNSFLRTLLYFDLNREGKKYVGCTQWQVRYRCEYFNPSGLRSSMLASVRAEKLAEDDEQTRVVDPDPH